MHKKLIMTLIAIGGALYAISQATILLNFSDISLQSFEERFSSIHFMAPGNNFIGGIFWLPTISVSGTHITLSGTTQSKICTKQVRGIYFNSQRGQRIRPLDKESLNLLRQWNPNYNNLTINGGLYTTCDSGNNYGIFGAITYNRGNISSYIVAGTKLNYHENKIEGHMANSFQYFDNKVPIGYLYDSNGGIGYVGGVLNGHEELIAYLNSGGTIQNAFTYSGVYIVSNNPDRETMIESGNTAMQTMRNLIIQGSVGLSKSLDEKERVSLLGNLQNKTIIYNESNINSSIVINFAKQKAQELCQGQNPYTNTTLGPRSENIICVNGHDLIIDLSSSTNYEGKTIIIKNGNAILENGMNSNSPTLDLFIDKGILYLPADPYTRGQIFNNTGFPDTIGVNEGLYLKGNFIINGLIIGNGNTPFKHKLHLQGKITTLNTPLEPNQGRINQITELLGPGYDTFINLQNIFTWTCGLSGTALSDNTPCGYNNVIASTPIVIINGNYPSKLLQ